VWERVSGLLVREYGLDQVLPFLDSESASEVLPVELAGVCRLVFS